LFAAGALLVLAHCSCWRLQDLFRRAGDYVDKIMRNSKPADLAIEHSRHAAICVARLI
jgi:hypothetical protein